MSIPIAVALHEAGLQWTPASGDRFTVLKAGMIGEIFVISDMTVDVHDVPGGRVIGFNGTTEWALDAVEQSSTVWLPRETQLREALAGTFSSLTRTAGEWIVTISYLGTERAFSRPDTEDAAAVALLHLIKGAPDD